MLVSGDATGGRAALVTAARPGAFATLSAVVPGHASTTTAVRLRVPTFDLPRGAARALRRWGAPTATAARWA